MKLIFVYNADTGLVAQVGHLMHRVLSPATYECNLCKISYGYITMNASWRKFIDNLGDDVTVEFLHRDEFHRTYPRYQSTALPAAFREDEERLELLITADQINQITSTDQLQALVREALA